MSHLSMRELSATLDGSLQGPALEQAREHLSGCIICQEHQERLQMHDGALRRLFKTAPDERALNDATRRSEALATAIIRGLPVPPLVTSVPLEDFEEEEEAREEEAPEEEAREEEPQDDEPAPSRTPLAIERLDRFSPPTAFGPATVKQDTTATPADVSEGLPPAREESRASLRLAADAAGATPLDVTPRLDMERAPAPQGERPLVETYDAFNDMAYAGPSSGRLPPMLGKPQEQKDGNAEQPPPRKEYRHGGVRRDTPSDIEKPKQQSERAKPEPRDEGFGVKRAAEPAWSRMGLSPDPYKPGVYRDPLTGAAVTPPASGGRRPVATPTSTPRTRTAVIATLATVCGIAAVVLALRIPIVSNLRVQFGNPGAKTTPATPGTYEVHEATSRTPVDVAVPRTGTTGAGSASDPVSGTAAPGALATEDVRLCGQVLDMKGRPIAGALFTVAGTMEQTRSDAAGRFCLAAPAGSRVVEVMDPRGAGTTTRHLRMEFVAGAPAARVVLP